MASQDNLAVRLDSGRMSRLRRRDLTALVRRARSSDRKRARFLLHRSRKDPLQEMLIVLTRETRIPPLKQPGRQKSYLVLEGTIRIVFFDGRGRRTGRVIELSAYGSGKPFYWRMNGDQWHQTVCVSPHAVFHEAITGPYRSTLFAPWVERA